MLHDSAHEEGLDFLGKRLPLAMDLTTPLIRRLSQRQMRNYEFRGVVDADTYLAQAGAYALDPYQPGKIPIRPRGRTLVQPCDLDTNARFAARRSPPSCVVPVLGGTLPVGLSASRCRTFPAPITARDSPEIRPSRD